MRLHVLSDLHLERRDGRLPAPEAVEADVVVLAGDIATGTSGVEWAREFSGGRPVLYVAGNHEFYGSSLPGLTAQLRAAAAGSSVQVLENDATVLGGVRFLGCTLWSDFDFDGPEHREQAMRLCSRVVGDYALITVDGEGRLTPADTRALHVASRDWLAARLAERHDGPTVVITHHAPLVQVRPAQPYLRAIAGAFTTDLTALMGGERIALWLFGHTHRRADVDIGGTRVLSNPRGYPRQPVPGFDPGLVVELPRPPRPGPRRTASTPGG